MSFTEYHSRHLQTDTTVVAPSTGREAALQLSNDTTLVIIFVCRKPGHLHGYNTVTPSTRRQDSGAIYRRQTGRLDNTAAICKHYLTMSHSAVLVSCNVQQICRCRFNPFSDSAHSWDFRHSRVYVVVSLRYT